MDMDFPHVLVFSNQLPKTNYLAKNRFDVFTVPPLPDNIEPLRKRNLLSDFAKTYASSSSSPFVPPSL